MKTRFLCCAFLLVLSSVSWSQDMSIAAKTSENLQKGDCFVMANEAFEFGLIYSGSDVISEDSDTSNLEVEVFNFIPIALNSEQTGLGQILQGTISIRCMDIEGPQCGYYEFQSYNKNGSVDTLLSQLQYVGAVNFPSELHTNMGSGGTLENSESFKLMFTKEWMNRYMDNETWKLYPLIDVMTLRKGLKYNSFHQE
ncbi:MAG: hypothetical protein ACFHU9_10880 [Fluviicola sp.]